MLVQRVTQLSNQLVVVTQEVFQSLDLLMELGQFLQTKFAVLLDFKFLCSYFDVTLIAFPGVKPITSLLTFCNSPLPSPQQVSPSCAQAPPSASAPACGTVTSAPQRRSHQQVWSRAASSSSLRRKSQWTEITNNNIKKKWGSVWWEGLSEMQRVAALLELFNYQPIN